MGKKAIPYKAPPHLPLHPPVKGPPLFKRPPLYPPLPTPPPPRQCVSDETMYQGNWQKDDPGKWSQKDSQDYPRAKGPPRSYRDSDAGSQ